MLRRAGANAAGGAARAVAESGKWGNLLNAVSIGSVGVPFLFKDKNTKAMEDIVSRQEALNQQQQNPVGKAYSYLNRVERPGNIIER